MPVVSADHLPRLHIPYADRAIVARCGKPRAIARDIAEGDDSRVPAEIFGHLSGGNLALRHPEFAITTIAGHDGLFSVGRKANAPPTADSAERLQDFSRSDIPYVQRFVKPHGRNVPRVARHGDVRLPFGRLIELLHAISGTQVPDQWWSGLGSAHGPITWQKCNAPNPVVTHRNLSQLSAG